MEDQGADALAEARTSYRNIVETLKGEMIVGDPDAYFTQTPPCGRVNLKHHCTPDCVGDFRLVAEGMTPEEAHQEASRCLRCDHFGYGSFKGGRNREW